MNALENPIGRDAPLLREQRMLFAEADHRIGNNLALIAAMLRIQANEIGRRATPLSPQDVRNLLAETAARIEAIGRLHRRLADANDGVVDAGEYLREIATSMVASVAAAEAVTTKFRLASSCALHANQVLPLGLIVGEVISNALKYAHPTGIPTAISVACTRDPHGVTVEIDDDGVGLPEAFDPASSGGLGFRLIRSLSEQLCAKPIFESTPLGLRFTLTVPN
jgi:two-component sensor histidine kinase